MLLAVIVGVSLCVVCSSHSSNSQQAAESNKQAMYAYYHQSNLSYAERSANAIKLLDQAIKTDSNYFDAYWNKFGLQAEAGEFENALVTGKEMIRLKPEEAHIYNETGMVYEKLGDTASARRCFRQALGLCRDKTQWESEGTSYRVQTQEDKAVALILLNKQDEGRYILHDLYETSVNVERKQHLLILMNMKRSDLVAGKTDTVISF